MFAKLKTKTQINILLGAVAVVIIVLMFFFFLSIYKQIREKNDANMHNIISQVESSVVKTTDNVIKMGIGVAYDKYVQEYLLTTDYKRKLELNYYIQNAVGSTTKFIDDVTSVNIIDRHGKETTFYSVGRFEDHSVLGKLQEQYFELSNGSYLLVTVPKGRFENEETYFAYIIPSYSLNRDSAENSKIGTVIVLCKMVAFRNTIQNLQLTKDSRFMIVDDSGYILVSNKTDNEGQVLSAEDFGRHIVFSSDQIMESGWKVVGLIPKNGYLRELRILTYFAIGLILIILLLFFAISFVFRKSVVNPLETLVKSIIALGDKNIKQRIDVDFNNEMSIIANSINSMLDRIEEMTKNIFRTQEKLYGMEISKNLAVISALQSQINPHFLYNTLECMRSIGMVNQIQEIVDISTAMAQIFRYSIKSGEYVTVRQELDIVKEYLKIMNTRYSGKFDVVFDIEETLYEKKIIKMIIQPIVENAIYHGLEKKAGKGRLVISGCIEDGKMIITVADNGPGMSEEKLREIRALISEKSLPVGGAGQHGIGLVNVNTLIRMHMGEEYGISIENIDSGGLMIRLTLAIIDDIPQSGPRIPPVPG